MYEHIPGKAGTAYANKPRHQEAVIDDEFTDMCCSRTVKADAGQIGRISRQNKITVSCRHKTYYY
mgnify:FL=1